MLTEKRLSGADYERMAADLEHLAAILHPEMSHDAAERLKVIAKEMRADAQAALLDSRLTPS